jgi:hypothetical protein
MEALVGSLGRSKREREAQTQMGKFAFGSERELVMRFDLARSSRAEACRSIDCVCLKTGMACAGA